jgi:hypothetical protein
MYWIVFFGRNLANVSTRLLRSVLGHLVSYNKTSQNNSLFTTICIFPVIYKAAEEMPELDALRDTIYKPTS